MSNFDEMISVMKTVDYSEKKQFLEYLLKMAEHNSKQFSSEDKEALLSYAYEEVKQMILCIPKAITYKEKDVIFDCENFLMGLIMIFSESPDNLSADSLEDIKTLTEMVEKERYIENTLDDIFEKEQIEETDINRLLYLVRECSDEYQKSKLFLGLLHYQQELTKLNDSAKQILTQYIISEIGRLSALDSEDGWNTLELLADVSKYFANEGVLDALGELMVLGHNNISFFAVETFLSLGRNVPQSVVDALAEDLEYANLTYEALQKQGKTELFPKMYANEEYLAKSDLVHWLTYPTELGKAPDEIVYIGKIKPLFKSEVFYVFKYRSDSKTLDDNLKNKWLIGWSSTEGGTFSNFDEFALYEKETTEKTLKFIKKNIIG